MTLSKHLSQKDSNYTVLQNLGSRIRLKTHLDNTLLAKDLKNQIATSIFDLLTIS